MHAVEGGLGDVDMACFDQGRVLAEEEGQKQGADVGAVHVGIGHDDNLVVAQLGEVHVVAAYAYAHGGDEGLDLLVGQHSVEAAALGVEDLAAQRKYGLVLGIASLLGGAACGVALDEEELRFGRILALAVGKLAGQGVVGEGALAADYLLGAAGRLPRPGGLDGLVQDEADVLGILFEVAGQAVVDGRLHHGRDLGVAELGFGLALELGVGQLDGDDGSQALAHVVARELASLELLDELGLVLEIAVDGAREADAEAREVGAALSRADVVGKGVDGFLVARGVLDGAVHGDAVHHGLDEDDRVEGLVAFVELLHEFPQAAFGVKDVCFVDALVDAFDGQALVEVGQLLEALLQHVVGVFGDLEDLVVRLEVHGGAVVRAALADALQLVLRLAPAVVLAVALAFPAHRDDEPFGQGVDAGDADAVQAAGHLVACVVELAAGVQLGHDDLDGGHAFLGMDADGNATAIVADRDAVVGVERDRDPVAVAGHGLVDGVVDDFVDQMVQAPRVRGADVHGRPFAHCLQAFEDGDGLRRVGAVAVLLSHS